MEQGRRKYLLYADDDLDDQQIMKDMIQGIDSKLEVIAFENGLEVIEFLNDLPSDSVYPCFIILDINMPQWDGIRTLQALKNDQNLWNIPVIIFSTSNRKNDMEKALELGAISFITKPVSAEDLEVVMNKFSNYCQDLPVQKKL